MHTIYSHPNEVCQQLYRYMIGFLVAVLAIFLGLYIIFALAGIGDRHAIIKEQTYVAKHIYLPGYNTIYEPEQHMDMASWVGSQLVGTTVTQKDAEAAATTNAAPKRLPEVEAAIALLSTGAFPGYTIKASPDGHCELYKPSNQYQIFTMEHPYRVSPWKPVKEDWYKHQ